MRKIRRSAFRRDVTQRSQRHSRCSGVIKTAPPHSAWWCTAPQSLSFRAIDVSQTQFHLPRVLIMLLIKIALALFIIVWLLLGAWMFIKYERLFGYHPDDPAETPGARTLNLTQIWSCWFGILVIMGYFLFR
ncbi:MAG: hypothetical protein ACK56K_07875 [Akkermansiaceae bacterium]|jgi:hypothetical protein